MPRFDGTGPMGYGSQTGRGFGPCGQGDRRNTGFGFGRGFGFQRWFPTRNEEAEDLKEYTENLEKELKAVKEKLSDLEKDRK